MIEWIKGAPSEEGLFLVNYQGEPRIFHREYEVAGYEDSYESFYYWEELNGEPDDVVSHYAEIPDDDFGMPEFIEVNHD